jgi:hypothetical protein
MKIETKWAVWTKILRAWSVWGDRIAAVQAVSRHGNYQLAQELHRHLIAFDYDEWFRRAVITSRFQKSDTERNPVCLI